MCPLIDKETLTTSAAGQSEGHRRPYVRFGSIRTRVGSRQNATDDSLKALQRHANRGFDLGEIVRFLSEYCYAFRRACAYAPVHLAPVRRPLRPWCLSINVFGSYPSGLTIS